MYVILNLIVVVINLFGLFMIFNGIVTPTETSIHQIYMQLIILTGVILFVAGLLGSVILYFIPTLKSIDKNLQELNELSKQVSDDYLYEEVEEEIIK